LYHNRGRRERPHDENLRDDEGRRRREAKSNTKNDRNDARELARLALADPTMLHPVFLRDEVYQMSRADLPTHSPPPLFGLLERYRKNF